MIIDSPPKKRKNNSNSIFKKIWILMVILLVLVIGIIIGGLLGFYGIFAICAVYDSYNPPPGPDGGMVAFGWMYTFITVPLGAMIGGIIALLIYNKYSETDNKNKSV